ncbi:uncharacterized protein LOC108679526 [Hyalella azteca]|uniref:Uncharacterized protein LOC108679526 n=1 Tax=Hyalella azteca TaxID=294128 RepID=A0A8B7PEC1_HYAAZ|nr:uncharacterized protein LOC108679526 [Hyalella azteca]
MPLPSLSGHLPHKRMAGSSSALLPAADADVEFSELDHNCEDQKPFIGHQLNLNPEIMGGQLKLSDSEFAEDDEDDVIDDDYEGEISEEQHQEMKNLNYAYSRFDSQRSAMPLKMEIPETSSLGEIEFSGRLKNYQEFNQRNSSCTSRADSPFIPVLSSGHVSMGDSQSTHTSDFYPSGILEDGKRLLEKLSGAPDSLEKALIINQALQHRFSLSIERLEETLKRNLRRQLLLHDQEDMERLTIEDEKQMRASDSRYFLRISSFCRPYFKTKIGMPAPMNEDAKERLKLGYLDMYQTRQRPWSAKEDHKLQERVKFEAKQERIKLLQQHLNALKREMKKLSNSESFQDIELATLSAEIVKCEDDKKELQGTPVRNISVPAHLKLDWIRIAAQTSDGHRSADECQLRWQALLSPNISQKVFSEEDDIAISAAVRSYGTSKPDWQAIANQLSEPRSAFQVFRRYQFYIYPALNPPKFTPDKSNQLLKLVHNLKVGDYIPWSQVHQQMPGFTRTQLQGLWKRLNPNRRKGPFNKHEDTLFVRGLHKYGLNLQQIVQFMPQRNYEQLKDRFRRIIVPIFLSQWTHEMDRELLSLTKAVERASLSTSFWRRLASVPGFAASGKDAAMLRIRYLILKLWQEVSLSDETTMPPLFPVSITRSEEDIALFKSYFLKSDFVEMREIVDKVNAGKHIKVAMHELQKRRARLHKQHDHHMRPVIAKEKPVCVGLRINHLHMHHLHQLATKKNSFGGKNSKAIDGRRIMMRTPSALTWPEQIIMDFFMPARHISNRPVNFATDMAAVSSLQLLLKVFQLRPMAPQSCNLPALSDDYNVTEAELGLVDLTINHHTCKTGRQEDAATEYQLPCVWCSEDAVPESMPLLAPCAATVGALQSLLMHRKTLRIMANNSFVLHRFKGPELYTLGEKPRLLRSLSGAFDDYNKGRLPMPGSVGKIHVTSVMPSNLSIKNQLKRPRGARRRNGGLNNVRLKKKKKTWAKRSIIDLYKSYKTGKNLSKYQGPKGSLTPNASLTAVNTDSTDGESTAVASASTEHSNTPAISSPSYDQNYLKTYKKPDRPLKKYSLESPTKYLLPKSKLKHNEGHESSSDSEEDAAEESRLTTEEQRARSEADNLLWHRFLSIFLLPAAMSVVRPTVAQEMSVQRQYAAQQADWQGSRENNHDVDDDDASSQLSISGAATAILQEVAPIRERKRKRAASPGSGSDAAKAVKGTPPPTRSSTRLRKTPQLD